MFLGWQRLNSTNMTFLPKLENVEHCGGEPEQAVTIATHE